MTIIQIIAVISLALFIAFQLCKMKKKKETNQPPFASLYIERGGPKRFDELEDLEIAKNLVINQGNAPEKILDGLLWSTKSKQWASDYINARDLANKLGEDLQPKTTTKTGRIKI
ncbi:hypothetical protein [Burkholderia contaminans]|uniref:hypothetical protein n=1 Tax=Burkholderia contaminans TaxID=488447 RepID=UPI00158DDF5E|nr:hypothetical protein [Burkholderia contaminans]